MFDFQQQQQVCSTSGISNAIWCDERNPRPEGFFKRFSGTSTADSQVHHFNGPLAVPLASSDVWNCCWISMDIATHWYCFNLRKNLGWRGIQLEKEAICFDQLKMVPLETPQPLLVLNWIDIRGNELKQSTDCVENLDSCQPVSVWVVILQSKRRRKSARTLCTVELCSEKAEDGSSRVGKILHSFSLRCFIKLILKQSLILGLFSSLWFKRSKPTRKSPWCIWNFR